MNILKIRRTHLFVTGWKHKTLHPYSF